MNRMLKNLLFGGPGSSPIGDFGLLILRVGVGLMIAIGHGKGKIFGQGGFGLPDGLVSGVGALGFPAPTFFAWCLALTEFAGGILLAVGLFTRPAALALAFAMGVAAFVAHGNDPWFMAPGVDRSKEPALLFMLPAIALMLLGAGRFAIDRFALRRSGGR